MTGGSNPAKRHSRSEARQTKRRTNVDKPKVKTNQKQVWIDNAQWEALKKISEDTGAPIAEIIRRAIADKLKGGK